MLLNTPFLLQAICTFAESKRQYCGLVRFFWPEIFAVKSIQVRSVMETADPTDGTGGVTEKHRVKVVSGQALFTFTQ